MRSDLDAITPKTGAVRQNLPELQNTEPDATRPELQKVSARPPKTGEPYVKYARASKYRARCNEARTSKSEVRSPKKRGFGAADKIQQVSFFPPSLKLSSV